MQFSSNCLQHVPTNVSSKQATHEASKAIVKNKLHWLAFRVGFHQAS